MFSPEKELTPDLKAWWDTETGKHHAHDPFASQTATGSVFDLQATVDSIRVVRALLVFEKRLPFKIPTTVIRAGGYDSFDDMATDLLSKVKTIFNKKSQLC